jgi:predicted flap endonuclease-1-like 5' DNA nuclease
MARWIWRTVLFTLTLAGLMALLLWWWLRRRPEEEVILRTKLGTITRVRGIGQPGLVPSAVEGPVPSAVEGPVPSPAEGPVLSEVEGPVLSDVEGPVPSDVEGPVLSEVEGPVLSPVEGPVLSEVEGTPIDDLTRIAGVGPKISNVLRGAGIATYAQLAATDVAQLKQILAESGIRVADPGTWPEQARLAAAGDWDALERLQGQLKGGRLV